MPEEGDAIGSPAQRPLRWWSRLWAFAVSPFFPGIGHALRGAYGRAWAFALAGFLALLLFHVLPYLPPRRPSVLTGALVIVSEAAILVVIVAAATGAVRFRRNLPSRRRIWWQRWLIYAAMIAVLSLPQFASDRRHWQSFSIPSTSMEPTLLVGDVILVVDGYYQAHAPQRGDLAVFKLPCDYPLLDPALAAQYRKHCDTSVDFIKRIVGLPGDHVQIKRGVLAVNDTPAARQADGTYLNHGLHSEIWQKYRETLSGATYEIVVAGEQEPLENTDVVTVPPDRYFMIGDNRDDSADSRDPMSGVGFVPAANLVGRPAIVQFSSNGSAAWWQIWKWPTAIRWSRIGASLE